jgi:trans-2-enoyl-CoA reductase
MDWWVFVCHVEVGDGNGAMVIVRCMDDWEGWVDCSMKEHVLSEQCFIFMYG